MNFIHFFYLYREQGKHRRYSSIVFHNVAGRTKEDVEQIIKANLTDGALFDHNKWGLRNLANESASDPVEPVLHEYVGVNVIEDLPTEAARDLEQFLELVRNNK